MNKIQKEIFEMEQELGVPSHLRWYNTKPNQECDGDVLTCLNEKCICKHNKIMKKVLTEEDIFNQKDIDAVTDYINKETSKQETVEDVAYNEFPNQEFYSSDEWSRAQRTCGREGFIRGSKWQSKKSYTEEEVRCWLIHRDVYLYNYYTTYKNLDIPLQSVEDFIEENHEYLMNRKK